MADVALLDSFTASFKQFQVYEYTEVSAILKQIPEASPEVTMWKEAMKTALYAMNQEKYKSLIEQVQLGLQSPHLNGKTD